MHRLAQMLLHKPLKLQAAAEATVVALMSASTHCTLPAIAYMFLSDREQIESNLLHNIAINIEGHPLLSNSYEK